jgi:phosphoribosylamine--glycine ligase
MRILVVGNGGREHALLWALHRDAPSAELYVTKPTPAWRGSAAGADRAGEVEALTGWAASQRIDLAVVGPEGPLAAGIADRFRKKGVPVFGPTADAARIESSKAFAKELMRDAGVPTAEYRSFSDPDEAATYIRERGAPIVVKASGLAAGKGAVVCHSVDDAVQTASAMLRDRTFGEAGREIVVEDFMEGEELSVFAVSDGKDAVLLLSAQDHKAVARATRARTPAAWVRTRRSRPRTSALLDEVRARVLQPTLAALAARECPFKGFLYAGLMLTRDGPKVVEFNSRMGDPEAQVVLPLMESGSLLELMSEVAEGEAWPAGRRASARAPRVTTVLASEGYPGDYPKGRAIEIPPSLAEDPDVLIFHAGTAEVDGRLVTAGGRVLALTGLGEDAGRSGRAEPRAAADAIEFDGKHFRRDIGWRELARDERTKP